MNDADPSAPELALHEDAASRSGESQGDDALPCVALTIGESLGGLGVDLRKLCSDSDPLFIRVGRALRDVSDETVSLADAIRHAAGRVHGGDDVDSTLDRTANLVQGAFIRMNDGRREIGNNLAKVRELVDHLLRFRGVCDTIDQIAAMFQVVRINIRVQCSSRSISEEIFREVSDDISSLSQNISTMTQKIERDLRTAEKDHATLEQKVAEGMRCIEQMTDTAETIVGRAFANIEALLADESVMIEAAGARSDVVRELVGEVVVAIQFHDSMTQRVDHVLRAFDDIGKFLGANKDRIAAGHLGTVYLILELQQRQIEQLVIEIGSIRETIGASFRTIAMEVQSLAAVLVGSHLAESGRVGVGGKVFQPLEKALLDLCGLIEHGDGMIKDMHNSAAHTTTVVGRLLELMEDIRNMHQETRVRAINTIIMASHLGEKGRTIEVLAREIRSLSDRTSALADDVTAIQEAMSATLVGFDKGGAEGQDRIGIGELQRGVEDIGSLYRWLEEQIAAVVDRIDSLHRRISAVGVSLTFLDDLSRGLARMMDRMGQLLDTLAPWQNAASRDSKEVAQLIRRYTMEQERLIHLYSRELGEQEGDEELVVSGATAETRDADEPVVDNRIGDNVEFF